MSELVKVVVDAMGGDYAPQEPVKAAVEAVTERKDIQVILTGPEDEVHAQLAKYPDYQMCIRDRNNRAFKEKLLTCFFSDPLLCKKTGSINLAQGFLSAVRTADLYFKGKALMIQIGSQFQAFNVVCSNFFQPYSLPDPALGSVEHAAWSQFLFSTAVIGCVTEIPH